MNIAERIGSSGEDGSTGVGRHPLEDVPAFDLEAAARRVEETKKILSDESDKTQEHSEQEHSAEHYDSPLDYINKNGLNDPNTLETIIQNGDYDSFKKHLINMNGLMRGLDSDNHGIDGDRVIVPEGLTPVSPELKEDLLKDMFGAMKDIDSPKDRGALAYHMLGMLHLFADGNGRSQRVWQQLFSGKQLSEKKMHIITEHESGDVGTRGRKQMGRLLNTFHTQVSTAINDFAFENDFDGYVGIRTEGLGGEPLFLDETITDASFEQIDRIRNIFRNDTDSVRFGFPEMTAYILKNEDESFGIPETFADDRSRLTFKADDDDVARFSFSSLSQVKRFIEIHNQLKVKQLRTMIDAFRSPQAYRYDNSEMTLVDVLEKPSFPRE